MLPRDYSQMLLLNFVIIIIQEMKLGERQRSKSFIQERKIAKESKVTRSMIMMRQMSPLEPSF